jgi:hypothetical protein
MQECGSLRNRSRILRDAMAAIQLIRYPHSHSQMRVQRGTARPGVPHQLPTSCVSYFPRGMLSGEQKVPVVPVVEFALRHLIRRDRNEHRFRRLHAQVVDSGNGIFVYSFEVIVGCSSIPQLVKLVTMDARAST